MFHVNYRLMEFDWENEANNCVIKFHNVGGVWENAFSLSI